MKSPFLILALVSASLHLRITHSAWDESLKRLTAVSDVLWNYCDVKCTYLERYFP